MDLHFRELREQRDLTEEDLSEISGVPLQIIRDIEIGISDVSVQDIKRVTHILASGIEGR